MTGISDLRELRPRITVFGVGGAGGNAINNMIAAGLQGVDFIVANTDAQALTTAKAARIPPAGCPGHQRPRRRLAARSGLRRGEEVIDLIREHLTGAHMVFVTAGMGGGTGQRRRLPSSRGLRRSLAFSPLAW